MVFERFLLLIVQWRYSNIKRQKPRSPDLIGARMSENTMSYLQRKRDAYQERTI